MNDLKDMLETDAFSLDITEPLPSHQKRFLAEHSTCAMCETQLDVRHEVNKSTLKVKEEAHCPSCGIRVRSHQYLMH